RRLLGMILVNQAQHICPIRPDGRHIVRRLVDFTTPDDGAPSAAFAQSLFDLGKCESDLGDWEAARRAYERGASAFEALGGDTWFAAKGRFMVGNCQVVLGERERGFAAMRENLRKIRDWFGPHGPVTLFLEYEEYARLLECGQPEEAHQRL